MKMAMATTSAAATVMATRNQRERRTVLPSVVRDVVCVIRTVGMSISSRSEMSPLAF
jgi:hypothetical protein